MIKFLKNFLKNIKFEAKSLEEDLEANAWNVMKFMPALVIGLVVLGVFYLYFGWPAKQSSIKYNPWTKFTRNIPTKITEIDDIKVKAISAVAFESDSKTRIFDQNADEVRSIASLTKLMTAVVFLDTKPNWDKEVVIEKNDLQAGARANVFVGDRIKIKDLFIVSLIASDNSAITALVRSTGLSEKDFVAKMNTKAKDLRLNNMEFSDPTGLDIKNRGTAASVAKLAEEAFSHQEIAQALKLANYSFSVSSNLTRKAYSTNQLLGRSLPMGAKMLIGKTGHLNEAGYCFAGIFAYKNKMILTTILGAPLDENRFSETIKLLDWTLRAYLWDNSQ